MDVTASPNRLAPLGVTFPWRPSSRARVLVAVAGCVGIPAAVTLVTLTNGVSNGMTVWLGTAAITAGAVALAWMMIRMVAVPLERLDAEISVFGWDDADPLPKPRDPSDIEAAIRHYTAVVDKLKARERAAREELATARETAKYSRLLQEAGIEIGGELAAFSLDQLSQLALDRVRGALDADAAILCLDDPASGKRVSATSGLPTRAVVGARGQASCASDLCPDPACPAMRDTMGARHTVPVAWGGQIYGELCVGFIEPRALTAAMRDFLRDYCHMLAIGISNARLHWRLETIATLEERERIAADLHDGIIQSLYGTGLGLLDCIRLIDGAPDQARERLEDTIDELNTVIRDVRGYIVGLGSEAPRRTSLTAAVRDFVLRMTLNGMLKVDLELVGECDAMLSREQSAHLFQICREAFLNIVKHAAANTARVTLVAVDGDVHLTIEDDGCGFDARGRANGGHGLRNMETRARRIGARSLVDSTPGRGTRIVIEVPVERNE